MLFLHCPLQSASHHTSLQFIFVVPSSMSSSPSVKVPSNRIPIASPFQASTIDTQGIYMSGLEEIFLVKSKWCVTTN